MILRRYPSLDLHGETRLSCQFLVEDFIKDHVRLKDRYVVIIHGKGKDILRKEVNSILKKNPYVESFCFDSISGGSTLVILRTDINISWF